MVLYLRAKCSQRRGINVIHKDNCVRIADRNRGTGYACTVNVQGHVIVGRGFAHANRNTFDLPPRHLQSSCPIAISVPVQTA